MRRHAKIGLPMTDLSDAGAMPFLWGAAISAHQSEGNNSNSDSWLLEHLHPTIYAEPTGDACDSFHRYREDVAIVAGLGLNCYRFGVEWARLEPVSGEFSDEAFEHYREMLAACAEHGLRAMVTLSHFTVPLWFAKRGGFEVADSADLFVRFAREVMRRLGDQIDFVTTFNEANIPLLLRLRSEPRERAARRRAMIAEAARQTDSPAFSSLLFADAGRTAPFLLDAHRRAYLAMKEVRPSVPVGITLTMQDIQAAGFPSVAGWVRRSLYGGWLKAAASQSDFVGVQTYTRARVGLFGALPPPEGAELTAAGYEYYPQALGNMIRFAARKIGKPIYVTESGIATEDDSRRIAFIDAGVAEIRSCVAEGIPVHGYIHWSLLDNFEWTDGFGKHFGLVAVDRVTFERRPKPSALHLGRLAEQNPDRLRNAV
jgi:beta-glucosidase